jgi:hypothetical protein
LAGKLKQTFYCREASPLRAKSFTQKIIIALGRHDSPDLQIVLAKGIPKGFNVETK